MSFPRRFLPWLFNSLPIKVLGAMSSPEETFLLHWKTATEASSRPSQYWSHLECMHSYLLMSTPLFSKSLTYNRWVRKRCVQSSIQLYFTFTWFYQLDWGWHTFSAKGEMTDFRSCRSCTSSLVHSFPSLSLLLLLNILVNTWPRYYMKTGCGLQGTVI